MNRRAIVEIIRTPTARQIRIYENSSVDKYIDFREDEIPALREALYVAEVQLQERECPPKQDAALPRTEIGRLLNVAKKLKAQPLERLIQEQEKQ